MLRESIVFDQSDRLRRRLIDAPILKGIDRSHIDLIQAECVDRGVHFKMTDLKRVRCINGIFYCLEVNFQVGVVLMVKLLSWPAKYLAVLEINDECVVFSDPCDTLCQAYRLTKVKK